MKKKIGQLADLAPLHNLADLEGIEVIEKLLPKIPQIAVFDTAFHHTMPVEATIYPGPYKWFEEGIRKYGFHGTSFQYCTSTAAKLLKKMPKRMHYAHNSPKLIMILLELGADITIRDSYGRTVMECIHERHRSSVEYYIKLLGQPGTQ